MGKRVVNAEQELDPVAAGISIEVKPSARVWFGSRLAPFEIQVVGRQGAAMDLSCFSKLQALQYTTSTRTVFGTGDPQQLIASRFPEQRPPQIELECTIGWKERIETVDESRHVQSFVRWRGTVAMPDIPRPRTTIADVSWTPCAPPTSATDTLADLCARVAIDRQDPFGYEGARRVSCSSQIVLPPGAPAGLRRLVPPRYATAQIGAGQLAAALRIAAPLDRSELTCGIEREAEDLASDPQSETIAPPAAPAHGPTPPVVEIDRIEERGVLHVGCGNCDHPDPDRQLAFVSISADRASVPSHVAVHCSGDDGLVLSGFSTWSSDASARVDVIGPFTRNPPRSSASIACTAYALPGMRSSQVATRTVTFVSDERPP